MWVAARIGPLLVSSDPRHPTPPSDPRHPAGLDGHGEGPSLLWQAFGKVSVTSGRTRRADPAQTGEQPNLDEHPASGLHRAPWMAGIAQLVERQVVVLDVTGSSPVARPTLFYAPSVHG